jgi:hypothetical protein
MLYRDSYFPPFFSPPFFFPFPQRGHAALRAALQLPREGYEKKVGMKLAQKRGGLSAFFPNRDKRGACQSSHPGRGWLLCTTFRGKGHF